MIKISNKIVMTGKVIFFPVDSQGEKLGTTTALMTEDGQPLLTEDGDVMTTES